jgi:hypothetical protein
MVGSDKGTHEEVLFVLGKKPWCNIHLIFFEMVLQVKWLPIL